MTSCRRLFRCWLLLVVGESACWGVGALGAERAPKIVFEEFSVEPTELDLGGSFTIRAKAKATGVPLGSFLLRTAEDVPREKPVPGLTLYSSGKWYMAEQGKYFLLDNGSVDEDPNDGAFAITVSTKEWKEGATTLAFFASRRPAGGVFVAARHDLVVNVHNGRVLVEDLGDRRLKGGCVITGFHVEPSHVVAGQGVTIAAKVTGDGCRGVRVGDPYYTASTDTLPGFVYDAASKKAYLAGDQEALLTDNGPRDKDAAEGCMLFTVSTEGWRPGLHHLQFELIGRAAKPVDYRSFAIKIPDPRDRLKVVVEDSWQFGEGTHFGRFLRLRDGTLFGENKVSTDKGQTWQLGTHGFGAGAGQLGDGTVVGLAYRCLPIEGESGWYECERSILKGGNRAFEKDGARVFVPEAKAAMGHSMHKGPLFMRSIIERKDGTLVALMAGWFKSDTALCPYGHGRPYSRSYVCESEDGGATWTYLTTIGYDQIGSEGYNEGSMRRLPSGQWLAVMRTGSEKDPKCHDNPIMWSVSADEGRTWSVPQRTGVEGAYPSLAVLEDGSVAMTYGRPGAMLVFSHDNGRTWTDQTLIDATPYSGYTDVVEVEPGVLLVGFGTRDFLDEATGERTNALRLVRVRYSE